MKNSRFKITPFRNPSGEHVFRVSGTLDGKMVRKNFRSRGEAVAFRQKLEIEFLNGESNGQTVWTTLTQDQNRDAIAAVNRLQRARVKKSLSFAVDFLLKHYRESDETKVLDEAVGEYQETRRQDLERGLISPRQFEAVRLETRNLSSYFGAVVVGEIQPKDIHTYLGTPMRDTGKPPSLKSWNNRRGLLSTFFKFCEMKHYVGKNPILEIPSFKVNKARGTAATLTADQAAKLMRWLESYRGKTEPRAMCKGPAGFMVPYFALALFAGIRPDWRDGEMSKLRPEAIRFDTEVIIVEPQVSKVNEKRTIKMQPNLIQWLKKYPLKKFPIIPPQGIDALLAAIRKRWDLPHDVLRHTYISMTVGAFRSVGDAALQAGNSEAVIRKHYLDLKSVEEADRFWSIVPKGEKLPTMEKREGRFVVG